jgi:hypothetical protein
LLSVLWKRSRYVHTWTGHRTMHYDGTADGGATDTPAPHNTTQPGIALT